MTSIYMHAAAIKDQREARNGQLLVGWLAARDMSDNGHYLVSSVVVVVVVRSSSVDGGIELTVEMMTRET